MLMQVNDMKAELEKHREELIKLEDDDPWHLDHQNTCPVKVTQHPALSLLTSSHPSCTPRSTCRPAPTCAPSQPSHLSTLEIWR